MFDFFKKIFTPPEPLTDIEIEEVKRKARAFMENEKLSCSPEKYKKWVRKVFKEIESQVKMRETKGLRRNEELEIVLEIYKEEYKKLYRENNS
jgi:hypothetical protein